MEHWWAMQRKAIRGTQTTECPDSTSRWTLGFRLRIGVDGKIPYGKEDTCLCSSTQTSLCALARMERAQNYCVLARFEWLFGFKLHLATAGALGLHSDARLGDFFIGLGAHLSHSGFGRTHQPPVIFAAYEFD